MVEREEHWCLAWCKILSSSFDGCVLVLLRHVMACDKNFQAFDFVVLGILNLKREVYIVEAKRRK